MDLKKLSEQFLEQALTEGQIQLDTGEVRKVTTQQILNLAREIVTAKVIVGQGEVDHSTSFPDEFYIAGGTYDHDSNTLNES